MHRMRTVESARQEAVALTDVLREKLNNRLGMVALYGSAARGDFNTEHSDVNTLVVLESAEPATLDLVADPLQQARVEFRCAPFVLTREEMARAADVFAAKFFEIRKRYILLYGEDLLRNLTIDPRELRHACEHELRNITLKIRKAYLSHRLDPRHVTEVLHRFVPQFLAIADVVMDQQRAPSASLDAGLGGVASHFGLDPRALSEALATRNDPETPWPKVRDACTTLLHALDKVSCAVDQWRCT